MAEHRRMSALQKKYFGKGHGSHKKSSKRGVYTAKKKGGHRFGGTRGKLGQFAPAIAGFAENVVNDIIPIPGVGTLVTGYGLKNQFCKDYGLYQVGYWGGGMVNLGGMLGGIGIGGGAKASGGYM